MHRRFLFGDVGAVDREPGHHVALSLRRNHERVARCGRFTNLAEVVKTLDREGYSASQIQGPLLKRQLTNLIEAARRRPSANDSSGGA